MNVTVDIDNDCPQHWSPAAESVLEWLSCAQAAIAREDIPVNVSVRIVTEKDSAALNRQYRGRDNATNVLSFATDFLPDMSSIFDVLPLGDIAICAPLVELEASQQGKTLEAHWAHLLTHGFLHLNGFHHQAVNDAEVMETLEITILGKLGFPNPYILH